ncbi:MAG: hypothetical protein P1S60_19405, partial [Anaerolineae bacterium]|nr:hypothetical protein [Anaerolineae bacterium]
MKRSKICIVVVLAVLTLVTLTQASPSQAGEVERVLVEFVQGRGGAVRAALVSVGGNIHYQFDRMNLFAVSLPSAALDGIVRNPNVVRIEPDVLRYPMAQT